MTIMTESEQKPKKMRKRKKSVGEQYLDYILDHHGWCSQEEADTYALLLFVDDLEEWKHEG